MSLDFLFLFNAVLLGAGLSMDAFSISVANSIANPNMHRNKMHWIAFVFGGFQFLMPLIGWACVHTIAEAFQAFQKAIPWIALVLLVYIGGKMLYEGLSRGKEKQTETELKSGTLIVQGVATSIDALSVGFAIAEYSFMKAFVTSLIIGAVTYGICFGGLAIGKKAGAKLEDRAAVVGGLILIVIGLEIFIKGQL